MLPQNRASSRTTLFGCFLILVALLAGFFLHDNFSKPPDEMHASPSAPNLRQSTTSERLQQVPPYVGPPTHLTKLLDDYRRSFPDIKILLVTSHESRAQQMTRIRHFLQDNQVTDAKIAKYKDLRAILNAHNSKLKLEDESWFFYGAGHTPVCVITMEKPDYSRESDDYWKIYWQVSNSDIHLHLDPVHVANWNLDHELYHCITIPMRLSEPHSMNEVAELMLAKDTPEGQTNQLYGFDRKNLRDMLYYEAGADLFAALEQLRRNGDRTLVEAVAAIRKLDAASDPEHYSSESLDEIIKSRERYNQATLKGISVRRLAEIAHAIDDSYWDRMVQDAKQAAEDDQYAGQLTQQGYQTLKLLEIRQKQGASPGTCIGFKRLHSRRRSDCGKSCRQALSRRCPAGRSSRHVLHPPAP